MIPRIPNIPPQRSNKNLELLLAPAQALLEQAAHHALDAAEQVLHLPGAEQLHARVAGPRVAGQLGCFLRHIHKTAGLEDGAPARRAVDW